MREDAQMPTEESTNQERDAIIQWLLRQRPSLEGPNYGLANDAARASMRASYRVLSELAERITAGEHHACR